ncbi:RNA polymerase sigma factor [Streptomyces sp. NBC_00989]|uniref:RNA polymerase sigma factor n=1 Tax=Streptomyces sp. NBC_00989 TaxID=2903705 RepID=UPI003863E306|nr:sigma-70 family RNA polymerase sigma factor [Streptomyces sp. NBC_00989]WSW98116.1 sigma-70 family RNA polymerase sigma factor [Streptomyces sp. NBC_00989]
MTVEEHLEAVPGGAGDSRPVIDEARLVMFYEQEAARLRRYLYRKAGANDAEDLMIHVFEQFFAWWPDNPGHTNPVASLYRIANCRLLDRLRSMGRDLTLVADDLHAAMDVEAGEDGFEAVDLRLDLDRALAELTEQQRQSLVLRYVAELSVQDCAETLGVSYENMKKILTKARDLLRRSPRMDSYEIAAGMKEVRR